MLVEVDLASSGQVSRGLENEVLTNVFRGEWEVNLSEVTKEPVCTASELVSTSIVGVQLNGPGNFSIISP